LPSVTLGKAFAECKIAFAECLRHSAKNAIPVVYVRVAQRTRHVSAIRSQQCQKTTFVAISNDDPC
jgi:hypothetical protein